MDNHVSLQKVLSERITALKESRSHYGVTVHICSSDDVEAPWMTCKMPAMPANNPQSALRDLYAHIAVHAGLDGSTIAAVLHSEASAGNATEGCSEYATATQATLRKALRADVLWVFVKGSPI